MKNRTEEWTLFLENLFECSTQEYTALQQSPCCRQSRERLDQYLETSLTSEQSRTLQELLFDCSMAEEQQAQAAYRQGMHDCAWLLKQLQVL